MGFPAVSLGLEMQAEDERDDAACGMQEFRLN